MKGESPLSTLSSMVSEQIMCKLVVYCMSDELGYLIIERLDLSKSSREVIAIGAKVILNSSS